MLTCEKCESTNVQKKGQAFHNGEIQHRFKCKECGANSYTKNVNILKVVTATTVKEKGWGKATIVTDEAKIGNIPEIGLRENLQGLEVTGVTYLKRDSENVLHWVKTKAKSDSVNMLSDFTDRLVDRVPAAAVIPTPSRTDGELLTQITITDLHVGMYSWAEETGADYDLKICYESISKAVDLAIEQSPDSEIGLLMELGDFAHYDGHDAVTPTSGNILDADGRFVKMLDVAEDILLESIEKMLAKYSKVLVIVANGNHDISIADTLRSLVRRYYRKNNRLEVIGTANPFYAYKHGKTMIGCHHGHLRKRIIMPSHFSQYFSKMWGETEYRYLHTGHLHSYHAEEKGGALTMQHSTLAAADAYAAHKFDKSLRSINTITYSSKYGMLSQNFIPIEMIYDKLQLSL